MHCIYYSCIAPTHTIQTTHIKCAKHGNVSLAATIFAPTYIFFSPLFIKKIYCHSSHIVGENRRKSIQSNVQSAYTKTRAANGKKMQHIYINIHNTYSVRI